MKHLLLSVFVSLNFISLTHAKDVTADGLFFDIPPIEQSFRKFGAAKRNVLSNDTFKVLVWNIYKGEMETFNQDIKALASKFDLLMIQEAVSSKMDVFTSIPGFTYNFGISFTYKNEPGRFTGSMVGSKVKPKRSWMARTKEREPVVGTPKALTMATYPIAGSRKTLLVVNIHGLNVTGHAAYESHLALSLAQMKGHSGPIIFAGDFNTRTKKRLEVTRQTLSHLGFKEMTFRNDERMRGAFGGHILDHVFTRGLEVVDSEVLGHLDSSDHKAMVFEARAL